MYLLHKDYNKFKIVFFAFSNRYHTCNHRCCCQCGCRHPDHSSRYMFVSLSCPIYYMQLMYMRRPTSRFICSVVIQLSVFQQDIFVYNFQPYSSVNNLLCDT